MQSMNTYNMPALIKQLFDTYYYGFFKILFCCCCLLFYFVFNGKYLNYFSINNKGFLPPIDVTQTVIIYANHLSDHKLLFGLVKYNCPAIPTKYMTTMCARVDPKVISLCTALLVKRIHQKFRIKNFNSN